MGTSQGRNKVELDEESQYVFQHFGQLLNPLERELLRYVYQGCPSLREPTRAELERGDCDETYEYRENSRLKEIVRRNGVLEALITARERLIREHPTEVVLNKCPRCQRLCRTPRSRQCFHCGHDWH